MSFRNGLKTTVSLTLCAAIFGCGAPENVEVKDPADKPDSNAAAIQDLVFQEMGALAVKAAPVLPRAFATPSMKRVTKRGKNTLAKQRKALSKAKEKTRAVASQVLATLLWDAAKDVEGDERTTLLTEARDALLALDGESALTLEMLAGFERSLDNVAGAITALETVGTKFAAEKEGAIDAQLAYLYSQSGRLGDAAALVGKWTIGEELEGWPAYALAWIQYWNGDIKAAVAAMQHALTAKKGPSQEIVEDELRAFLPASGMTADEAAKVLEVASNGSVKKRYKWMFELATGFATTGAYGDAKQTLDALLATYGADAPATDRVAFRFKQADYLFRSGDPLGSAEATIETTRAQAECSACSQGDRDNIALWTQQLGQLFHSIYSATFDTRYYEGAKALYGHYATLERDDAAAVQKMLSDLETVYKSTPKRGKYDQSTVTRLMSVHADEIASCYAWALGTEPTLAGRLAVTVSFSDKGEATGAVTEPPAGDAGLARVGRCAEARARKWTLPSRTIEGNTAVVVPFDLQLTAP